ncbi:MAG: peptide ABC transporter substrate-binding protein [Patescibacteria group bacterium]
MNWRKLLFWLPKKRRPFSSDLDKKLVKNVRLSFIPSFSQIKYTFRFLNTVEKRAVIISLSVMSVAILILGGNFFASHLTPVAANGGDYTEALVGQPSFINPLFASLNDVDADISYLVYSGLFRFNKDGKLEPDLATEYSVDSSQKKYTIKLRQDARWSDGEPFNADDVIYTFQTVQNQETNSPLIIGFQGVTVEKTDDYEIKLTLKEPFAPFLNSLTLGILPEHIWNETQPTSIRLAKTNLQPVGAGPWAFSKLIKDNAGNIQSYTLVKNKNYYGQKPYLDTVTFKFFGDYAQAASALRSQTVDALSFIPYDLKEKIPHKSIGAYTLRLPQYTAMFFNQIQEATLKDADLRKALAMALDKKKILEETVQNEGEIIDAPILPGSIGYYAKINKISFNVEEANKLLDKKWQKLEPETYFQTRYNAIIKNRQAEINAIKKTATSSPETVSSTIAKIEKEIQSEVRQEMNSEQSFYRADKDKNILRLTITTADTPEFRKAAETISRMWRAIGVQTNLKIIGSQQLVKENIKNRDYQILLYGEIIGADPDPYAFWHSSQNDYPGLNLAMFTDRNADKMLEEARSVSDPKKRDEIYKKFQEILAKENPAVFLYAPTYTLAVSKTIKGVTAGFISSPSDRFVSLNEWYAKTKLKWK